MKSLAIVVAITVCLPAAALAGRTFTSNHPEEQYPADAAPITSGGRYEDMLKQVQEKLNALGFDAGPANGTFNTKTQAALAQYQRAYSLPVSGAMDGTTLAVLGVETPAASETPAATESPAVTEKPTTR
jgi:peptidoglycan hydrolase-like protein with peptidoglycan-binding domain